MAEDFDSRTEPATPRRREEAREQGQVAYSPELNTGVILLAGLGVLALMAHHVGSELLGAVRLDLIDAGVRELSAIEVQTRFRDLAGRGLHVVGPLLGVLFAAGLVVSLGQAGFHPNPALLTLRWERVLPFAGGSRFFSLAQLIRGATGLLKVILVGLLAWWVLAGLWPQVGLLGQIRLGTSVVRGWSMVVRLGLTAAAGLFVLGAADYLLQLWRFERQLRMTRQEIKDEVKRDEGDPQVKARIRRLQRETAQKKMFREVPHATVVVTNPTHLAIALRYERGSMAAPRVVAKGAGHVAKRIAEMARRHGVPVLERKSLAQALFKTVKLNQDIPVGLYYAVAEVLAYVYGLRGGVPALATNGTANNSTASRTLTTHDGDAK